MKAVVIYFSVTGNTEKIAYAIQTGVKQVTGHCDILKIKEANPRRLYKYDLIGIGAPTMSGGPLGNVTAFIKDMRFVGGKHCLAFSTHGTLPINFFAKLIPKLKERGLIVIGYDDWYGGGNHVRNPGPWYTEGHPDEIDLEEAEAFGREMVARSVRISAGETNLIPEVPALIDQGEWAPEKLFKGMPSGRELVKFEKEKCLYPACRLCMDNCPSDGIDLTVDPPVIATPCVGCGGMCEAICPTGAMNWEDDRARPTQEPGRGHIIELGLPALREAEKQGRFRRKISEEEVQSYKPPDGYRDIHPRFIIGKGRVGRVITWKMLE